MGQCIGVIIGAQERGIPGRFMKGERGIKYQVAECRNG